MATTPNKPAPEVARVDHMVDENGARVEVPNDSGLRAANNGDPTVGSTGPTNWWLYGLIGMAILIAVLLIMQLMTGAPGTDVQPGSPVSEPVVEPAVPPQ